MVFTLCTILSDEDAALGVFVAGAFVGSTFCLFVGLLVGGFVGAAVGAFVGATVGGFVGAFVGVYVTASLSSTHAPSLIATQRGLDNMDDVHVTQYEYPLLER